MYISMKSKEVVIKLLECVNYVSERNIQVMKSPFDASRKLDGDRCTNSKKIPNENVKVKK